MENNKHIADGFVNGLKKFTGKLEQLQLEISLGKAEAKDKLDEYQKNLKDFLRDSKLDLQNGTGLIGKVRQEAEELEVKMELGKMEAKEYVSEHKKQLFNSINKIDKMLENKLT